MVPALTTAALLAAGLAGGALNSVAGGGSFFVFPTMLVAGIPPVAANATTAVALWPAGLASAAAYRDCLPPSRAALLVLGAVSVLGGALGAGLLLGTSDATFARILPWLLLTAAVVFTAGPRATRRAQGRRLPLVFGAAIQLVISLYGGYFGGGMGIMMLAIFTLMGMTDIHEMNALKVILGALVNGAALVAFFLAGKVVTSAAIPVAVGAVLGGWSGAALARRVAPAHVRRLVLAVAWTLTAWFFYRG